jgi:hypothetical protein
LSTSSGAASLFAPQASNHYGDCRNPSSYDYEVGRKKTIARNSCCNEQYSGISKADESTNDHAEEARIQVPHKVCSNW